MTTIEVNERTKAGKLLLETARMLARENKGILITSGDDDRELAVKMTKNRKGDFLTEKEQAGFIAELKKTAGR